MLIYYGALRLVKQFYGADVDGFFCCSGAPAIGGASSGLVLRQPRDFHQSGPAPGGSGLPAAWGVHVHPEGAPQQSSSEQHGGSPAGHQGRSGERGDFLASLNSNEMFSSKNKNIITFWKWSFHKFQILGLFICLKMKKNLKCSLSFYILTCLTRIFLCCT